MKSTPGSPVAAAVEHGVQVHDARVRRHRVHQAHLALRLVGWLGGCVIPPPRHVLGHLIFFFFFSFMVLYGIQSLNSVENQIPLNPCIPLEYV